MLRFTTSSILFSSRKLFFPCRRHLHELAFTTPAFSAPAVSPAYMRIPRSGKKAMSNTELVDEIKEFLSSVGLPEEHVPSTKELSLHGRDDLANIVRRRGYKFVQELLTGSGSDQINVDGSDVHESLAEKQAASSSKPEQLQVPADEHALVNSNEDSGHDDDEKSSPAEDSTHGQVHPHNSMLNSGMATAQMAKFMEDGYRGSVKNNLSGLYNHIDDEKPHKFYTSDHGEAQPSSPSKVLSVHVYGSVNAPLILQGTTTNQFSSATNSDSLGNSIPGGKGLLDAYTGKKADTETSNGENQPEISQLKNLLNQKDLELSLLKEQVAKEKAPLQPKADNEIEKARKLLPEKDNTEIQTAEESPSGLKEVEIKYHGDGDSVEVAGSFNGWQHRIKMDPQPSAGSSDSQGSRKSQLWTTKLSLYPGLYEIKFVVDGQWKVDPEKESTTIGSISNNVLRVES